jgi:O-antigen/teichoic acid export membrane protein
MPSIRKNFFYSGILTTASYLFPLLTFPYVSRVLGVTNIGIVNFVDSCINYFILVSMMGINIVGIREIAKNKWNKDKLNQTFSGLFLLNTITTAIALVVLIIVTLSMEKLLGYWHLMCIGALKLIMNFLLIEWLYKGLEEFKYITVRTIIVKIFYVVLVFVFVRCPEDYPIYYFLSVMMIAVNSIINLAYSRGYVSLKWRNVNMFLHFKPYFVLGIYSLFTSMYLLVNVSWLGFVSGEKEVGFYTTASKLFEILIALFTAFTGVMLPRMSSLLAEGKVDEFKNKVIKVYHVLFSFSIPLVLLTVVNAPTIISIIAGPGYEGAIIPMRIMMPLIIVIGYEQILIMQMLMPLKKDNVVLWNSILGALTCIVLSTILIPKYASIGTAIVWFCSEIVVLCSAQYYVIKYISISFPWRDLLTYMMMYLPLCVGILVFNTFFSGFTSLLLSCIFTAIYFIISNIYIKRNEEFVGLVHSCLKIEIFPS